MPETPSDRPRDTSKDGRANKVIFHLLTHGPGAWRLIQRTPPLARLVNRWLINEGIKKAPPRPYRLSTMAPYTSWASLTDKTFNSRQLPPVPGAGDTSPSPDEVATLFLRHEMIECPKSTVLFAYVAQWFTDGFMRSRRPTPPEQTRDIRRNESNHEVDLTQLYGLDRRATDCLRARRGGLLKSQEIGGESFPEYLCDEDGTIKPEFRDDLRTPIGFDGPAMTIEKKRRLFAMGSDAGNSQVGYAMLTVLFLREHNRIAGELAREHPDWDDTRLFETTRNILTVLLIKLVIEEYINHIAPYHFEFRFDPTAFYSEPWYRPNWMAVEFNILYRWHSLIPSTLRVHGKDVPINDTLNDTEFLTSNGLGPLFEDASRQPAGRVGLYNTAEWFMTRTELPSIRQSRTAQLAGYNDYREHSGFPRVTKFEQISSDPRIQAGLRKIYGSVDNIEFYVGLLAEDRRPNSVLPSLAGRLVGLHAFSQLMTNPLLAPEVYEKRENREKTFSRLGVKMIEETSSLSELVHRNLPAGSRRHYVSLTREDWQRE